MPGKSPIVTPTQVQSNSIICSTCGAQLNSFECGVKCRACQSWFHPHPCSNVTVDMLEAIQISGLNDVAHWFCQDCEGMLTEACTSLGKQRQQRVKNEVTSNQPTGVENGDTTNGQSTIDILTLDDNGEKTSAVATPSAWEARQASQGSSGLGEELLASGGTSSRDPLNATAHLTTSAQVGVTENEGLQKRQKPGSKSTKKTPDTKENQERLASRLDEVLREKSGAEDKRQELFNNARQLHLQIQTIREQRREKWFREFNEVRRVGTQLEEKQGALRNELDSLHRRIIGSLIRRQPLVTGVKDEPSRKANYKISVIRLRHEIEDLKRRVEAMDIKVDSEVKLRTQAEREVKQLRNEVSRKKANVALSQSKPHNYKTMAHPPTELLIKQ